jgi:hypothetical protein
LLAGFPIPQRLRDVGFDRGKIEDAAAQVAALAIEAPRPAGAGEVRTLLEGAY